MTQELIENVFKKVSTSLNSIYKKRKRTLFLQKIMWVITGIYIILLLLNMLRPFVPNLALSFFEKFEATAENPYASLYPFIALMVFLYPTVFYFTNSFKKYKEKENATVHEMIKMLFPKAEFSQSASVPRKEITSSKIFAWSEHQPIIASYGQMKSVTEKNIINIADIGFIEENITNKLTKILMMIPGINMLVMLWNYTLKSIFTNKTADNIHYTFRGMFCWLKYPKKLNGHTVVLTNNQKSKIDRFTNFTFGQEQRIFLEDPRFTDKFIVYSTDQVEARYVLSTALMERIVALQDKFNRAILLSFHNAKMYLAVENSNGLFSFSSGKLDDIKIVEELANDIETALQVSENLKIRQL